MISVKVRIDTSGFQSVVSQAKTRGITLKGVKAGIRVLQAAAKAAAPRRPRSGALKQAQGVLARKGRAGTTISFAVQGARKRVVKMVRLKGYKTPQKVVPAFYDHLVIGGTKPHRLGKGELLARVRRGRTIAGTAQATGGRHPGSKPNPYRKRAYESVRHMIGKAVNEAMAAELRKLIAKQQAKAS